MKIVDADKEVLAYSSLLTTYEKIQEFRHTNIIEISQRSDDKIRNLTSNRFEDNFKIFRSGTIIENVAIKKMGRYLKMGPIREQFHSNGKDDVQIGSLIITCLYKNI